MSNITQQDLLLLSDQIEIFLFACELLNFL